ncbi:branched-chain amino acid ABC transporter permease [Acidisoma cellulosilytica]|uniref:Branched-chain amino acid ABC transporter permease n=1 Tax=Acidisoma cellulosilyticum TaxID=2802395 RepID=A0A963Z730_9PROT|nr:branched-chain amino acid ABC transporter permease [Acidisoma cellulosilyticum]MCB8883783.1 branched-chain amino acid ABC transporter permease [Acidisoma cellulosilyticum]
MTDLAMMPQLLASGIMMGCVYGLLALCFYVVHAGTGIINFAQGDFVVLGLIAIWTCIVAFHMPLLLAIPLTVLATGLTVGLLERLLIAPARSREPSVQLLITLALGILIRGLIQLLWGSQPQSVPSFSGDAPIHLAGAAILPQALWIVGGTMVILAVLHFVFTRTLFGLALRGAAGDREGARVIGLNAGLISFYAFGLSALISGAAAAVIAPVISANPLIGLSLSLKGFAGAILGGIDRPQTAVLGGVFIGILETFVAGLISSDYQNMFVFGVLMLVIVIRPAGLLGKRT